MRRLIVYLGVIAVLSAAGGAFSWWIDPFGQVWKPGVMDAARKSGCLVSQELLGSRYWPFKRDVFFHRPTREFVVGSSRVLKIGARPGENDFSNLGYPGTSPETILALMRSLPAEPAQTVYVGVEAFWFNKHYVLPQTDLSRFQVLEYLMARSTFTRAVTKTHERHWLLRKRWQRETVGGVCVLDRFTPAITWRTDGSRVWGWELDPKRFPKFGGGEYAGDLQAWRNGYYADWRRLDERRLRALEESLQLARERGWKVVGFAPPEPRSALGALNRDPRLAPRWHEFTALMPQLFARYGYRWQPTYRLPCPESEFPDRFHTDAQCSNRLHDALR
jgi:hypothetical protein